MITPFSWALAAIKARTSSSSSIGTSMRLVALVAGAAFALTLDATG
jgi:hypothetical protein